MASLIHVANALILASFLVRDILWLRCLSILGGLAFIGYFALALPEPLYAPVLWNGLFIAINAVQIARLLAERRPVFLDARQQRLHALAFQALTPRELTRLLEVGVWETRAEALVRCGDAPECLILLCDGDAHVFVDGHQVATLRPGQFVGEMAWLTGRPASADVLPDDEVTVVVWPFDRLRELLTHQPTICRAVQRQLGADLARKLRPADAVT